MANAFTTPVTSSTATPYEAQQASIDNQQNASEFNALPTVVSDLDSDNYLGAFQAAVGSQDSNNWRGANTNPLIQDLTTSYGLNSLDPNAQWTQADDTAYYDAATSPGIYNNLGSNAYGLWGNASDASKDAAANYNATPGAAPNIEQYAGQVQPASFGDKFAAPLIEAAVTAGFGAAGAPALAASEGVDVAELPTLTAAAANAGSGALAGSLGSALRGGNPLTGALTGGITGGLGTIAQPLTSSLGGALSNAGLSGTASSALASGITKGAIGAGVGALGGALSANGSAASGALTGGVSGAASGLIGNLVSGATGSPAAGNIAGTIGSTLAKTYLTPTASASPTASTASPTTATSAAAPATAAASATAATPTTAPSTPSTNIGAYSGFSSQGLGYAPRQQVDPGITNYNTYGQGPEAQFYAPLSQTSNTQPITSLNGGTL